MIDFRSKFPDWDSIVVRPRYFGWFVASVFLVVLTHIFVIISLFGAMFGVPRYLIILTVCFSFSSVAVLTHFLARTFAPYEHPKDVPSKWRSGAAKLLLGAVAFIIIYLNVFQLITGLKPEEVASQFGYLGSIFALVFYLFVAVAGWRTGRLKNAVEVLEYLTDGQFVSESIPLRDYIPNNPLVKFFLFPLMAGILATIAFLHSGIYSAFNVFAGALTVFGTLDALYPEER